MARLLRLRSVSPLLIGAVAVIVPFLVMTTHGHHKVMLSGTRPLLGDLARGGRRDGGGYPNGRTAHDLDIETRILTVCDVYDALLSVRVYRDAWSRDEAMDLLREERGAAVDAACVRAL
jgi:hypothetical protein